METKAVDPQEKPMNYISKAKKVPKNLKAISVIGADGRPINPGDGVVAGGARRAASLNFGIYLGVVDTSRERRVYYESGARTWNGTAHVSVITAKYMTSYLHAKYISRLVGIPAAQAQAAQAFQS